MAQREAKARDVALEMGGAAAAETGQQDKAVACGAATAGVACVGLAGAGVLVWWVVAFHPTHEQLWMVPVGLVLLGTPLIAWLSLLASGACRWLGRRDQAPAVAPER